MIDNRWDAFNHVKVGSKNNISLFSLTYIYDFVQIQSVRQARNRVYRNR